MAPIGSCVLASLVEDSTWPRAVCVCVYHCERTGQGEGADIGRTGGPYLWIIIELNLGHGSIWHDIMEAITDEIILLLVRQYLNQSILALGSKTTLRPK